MTKEVMITILNLHGIDTLYSVISDELIKKYNYGYDKGYSKGYDDGKEDGYITGFGICYDSGYIDRTTEER